MKNFESLKKYQDFKYVYNNGRSFANKYFVMYVSENHLNKNRLGISVSKKVGNSVVRHRVTRLIRESYRLQEKNLKSSVSLRSNSSLDLSNQKSGLYDDGLDIVVIARNAAAGIRYAAAESAFCHLAKLHKIM